MNALPSFRMPPFIVLAFGLMIPLLSPATVKMTAHKAQISSHMRMVAIAFNTYTISGARIRYHPEHYENMASFLKVFTSVDLFEADIFLSPYDLKHAKAEPPEIIGFRSDSGKSVFVPDILEFPIAYSFGVYPDLDRPASTTPLLWTRGLHNYKSFGAPYGGHITFLDGHVEYFEGQPGQHDQELEKIFGLDSEFSKAIRILEHDPEGWTDKALAPLPLRYTERLPSWKARRSNTLLVIFVPALFAAFLVGLLPKILFRDRIWSALIAFCIVLIATFILFSVLRF